MIPWLVCMFSFACLRLISFIFAAIVNDMIFAYNIIMCLFWIVFSVLNFASFSVVYSLFLELADLTKLEDLAHLRVSTISSYEEYWKLPQIMFLGPLCWIARSSRQSITAIQQKQIFYRQIDNRFLLGQSNQQYNCY